LRRLSFLAEQLRGSNDGGRLCYILSILQHKTNSNLNVAVFLQNNERRRRKLDVLFLDIFVHFFISYTAASGQAAYKASF